jgi:hypothetical protein
VRCRAGGAHRFSPRTPPSRNRRARQQCRRGPRALQSKPPGSTGASKGVLASGGCERSGRRGSAASKGELSCPPDMMCRNRICRIKRCFSFVNAKLITLLLKKLEKSAIKKNRPVFSRCGGYSQACTNVCLFFFFYYVCSAMAACS